MTNIELEVLNDKATGQLLMADVFDEAAFKNLYSYICEVAEAEKG